MNITSGELDVLLAGLGLAQGDSLVGQWDVWAFRNNAENDSLKASNGPRAITLKRAKPLLTAFNLSSPLKQYYSSYSGDQYNSCKHYMDKVRRSR
ncbi:MAG: hypothetical protein R3A12_16080 [Ignavibacteria bacterium]